MAALGQLQIFSRDMMGLERVIEHSAVLRRHWFVVHRVREKGRWRAVGHLLFAEALLQRGRQLAALLQAPENLSLLDPVCGAGANELLHYVDLTARVCDTTELDRTDFHPNPWIAERERQGLLRADKVIAVSNYTKNMLTTHYGIPQDKIAVVYNGHDQPRDVVPPTLVSQHGETKRPLVLFLGRLTVQKNPWQFLEIAELVHRSNPDVRFVMAGDGPMLPSLIDRACERKLDQCVFFTGKVSRDEVQGLYREADCFVMPSISEPFGLVALEAIAHGTPVILSKQSGVSEVIQHAFKVDYWNADLMADCILTVLREKPLALQLRSEAPRELDRLSWKNQATEINAVYQNMIQA